MLVGLVQAARNCHFTTVAREQTGAGQATKKQLSAGVSPKTGKVFLAFRLCVLFLLEEDDNLDPLNPSKHSGSVDGDPAKGDAQKCF